MICLKLSFFKKRKAQDRLEEPKQYLGYYSTHRSLQIHTSTVLTKSTKLNPFQSPIRFFITVKLRTVN